MRRLGKELTERPLGGCGRGLGDPNSLLALPTDAPLHPWLGLFNWSAITLWLTCTVVLALRLLRVARAAPRRSRAMTTEPDGQAAQPSTTGYHARHEHNLFDELPAWTGQASVRDGWPLHVLENAGHFMVAEPPEAFLEALRAALGNR